MKLYHRDIYPQGAPAALRRTRPGDAEPPVPKEEPPLLLNPGAPSPHAPVRVAILLPTRGTVFSLAIESIIREAALVTGCKVALFMTHGLGIPQAQQNLIKRALDWHADFTWLVEEDNYMPPGVLAALLTRAWVEPPGYHVVTCDYYNHQGSNWVVERTIGKVDFYAFGCTLVSSGVWRKIGAPYCFNGHHIKFDAAGNAVEDLRSTYKYGGQDIDFSFRIHKLGIKGARLDGAKWRAGHLSITKEGTRGISNQGTHTTLMS